MDFIKKMYKKYEDVFWYLVFGVLTTIVNILVYYVFANIISMNYLIANVIAWAAAVLFAYVTNRIFVFKSTTKGLQAIVKEFSLFVGCRLVSGGVDMGIMFLMVSTMGINDMIAKIVCQIIVIVSNYIFSKLIIFKK